MSSSEQSKGPDIEMPSDRGGWDKGGGGTGGMVPLKKSL